MIADLAMSILWVKADKLLPVQNRGNIRSYHVLRYLSARHQLTFYSYYGGSTVAAEALDVHYGRDIMLADEARSFAQAVILLLGDSELRRRYANAAAETAARCDWPAIGEHFSEVLQSVAEKNLLRRAPSRRPWRKRMLKRRRGLCGHRR